LDDGLSFTSPRLRGEVDARKRVGCEGLLIQ